MNHFYNEDDGAIYFHCGRGGHREEAILKEPLIKSLHNALSDGFSSVGSDAYGFNQCFLNAIQIRVVQYF